MAAENLARVQFQDLAGPTSGETATTKKTNPPLARRPAMPSATGTQPGFDVPMPRLQDLALRGQNHSGKLAVGTLCCPP